MTASVPRARPQMRLDSAVARALRCHCLGRVAQPGERLPRTEEVESSNLFPSTNMIAGKGDRHHFRRRKSCLSLFLLGLDDEGMVAAGEVKAQGFSGLPGGEGLAVHGHQGPAVVLGYAYR